MLNSDDPTVRELARASLLLDMGKRKVPRVEDTRPSFLGFKQKPSGKLDTNAAGFGVNSDWPDLNDLANWSDVSLDWRRANGETVRVSEAVISDPAVTVCATVSRGDETSCALPIMRAQLLALREQKRRQRWTGLRLQGKVACLQSADHSVSHSFLKNTAIDEDILVFAMKARLQVLPTNLNLSIWYPNNHNSFCLRTATNN